MPLKDGWIIKRVSKKTLTLENDGKTTSLPIDYAETVIDIARNVPDVRNNDDYWIIKLPCLFTIEKVNYKARIPGLKGKMAAKRAKIITVTADDIPGLDRSMIGDPGSPTKTTRTYPPEMPEPGIILNEGSMEANVSKLLSLISE